VLIADQEAAPTQTASTNTGLTMSSQPGQVLFKKLCAPCHTVGVGDRVGPDLRGVATRRDHTWLSSFIQSPAKLRARQDPDALALATEYPAVRMPALGLSQNDAADLISYLAAETSRLADADVPVMPASAQHDHHHHH
jgi:protein SCO1/2